MDWDHLRFFIAVADAGSLHGAARKLGVNHSTVFRRINRLEADVGARLFERLSDGYALTNAGDDLLVQARQASEHIEMLQLKVLGKDYQPSGTVRLTTPNELVQGFISQYLKSFSDRYPEIDLELLVSDEMFDLSQREADIAVRPTRDPPEYLVGQKLMTARWGYYASKQYLRTRGRPRDVASLEEHVLIGAAGSLKRIAPFSLLESERMIELRMRSSTLSGMSALAAAGCGIALLPDPRISPSLVRLFDTEPVIESDIWALIHPELKRTERVRLLMKHLVDSFRNASTRAGA